MILKENEMDEFVFQLTNNQDYQPNLGVPTTEVGPNRKGGQLTISSGLFGRQFTGMGPDLRTIISSRFPLSVIPRSLAGFYLSVTLDIKWVGPQLEERTPTHWIQFRLE